MHLTILISTIDLGILKVANVILPFRSDVKYIVSHQFTNKEYKFIPIELMRKDIEVSQIFGRGLSISRNNALQLAENEICVIADDDVSYTNAYFNDIINIYNDREVDVACFKIKTREGESEYKNYPSKKIKFVSSPNFSISSIEITFRTNEIKRKGILFDDRFGIGSDLAGGEETIFIHDCIHKGLNVYFFPKYIVEHPFESTIKSLGKYHKNRNKVRGALDYRLNGKIAYLKCIFITIRSFPDLIRNKKNPFKFFSEILSGCIYIAKSERNKGYKQ